MLPGFFSMLRALTFACLLLAMPVLGVLGSWLALDAGAVAVLRHQAQTVLPDYAANSLWLVIVVGIGHSPAGLCDA